MSKQTVPSEVTIVSILQVQTKRSGFRWVSAFVAVIAVITNAPPVLLTLLALVMRHHVKIQIHVIVVILSVFMNEMAAKLFHRRNKFNGNYDFTALIACESKLSKFIVKNKSGCDSLDFSDPTAVKLLNSALLKSKYGLQFWDVPQGYLVPGVPGRLDYIHHIADLLSSGHAVESTIPRGPLVQGLDIGTGSTAIYPTLGTCEYGWSFVGVDIDIVAIKSAEKIVEANSCLKDRIRMIWTPQVQQNTNIFSILPSGPRVLYAFSMCNPPFHASVAKVEAGIQRKWNNLGLRNKIDNTIQNFGGVASELVCPGGELRFLTHMISSSGMECVHRSVIWFTSLVSKQSNIPILRRTLASMSPIKEVRVIDMSTGNKASRILAWTYFTAAERERLLRRLQSAG